MAKLLANSLSANVDYKLPYAEFAAAEDAAEEDFRQQFRQIYPGDTVGYVLSFQRGDGFARYMVVKEKPLTLAHMNFGDAWRVEAALIRGLRLSDVRDSLERDRRLAELFAKRKRSRFDNEGGTN